MIRVMCFITGRVCCPDFDIVLHFVLVRARLLLYEYFFHDNFPSSLFFTFYYLHFRQVFNVI